jgi:hypothetical protein
MAYAEGEILDQHKQIVAKGFASFMIIKRPVGK